MGFCPQTQNLELQYVSIFDSRSERVKSHIFEIEERIFINNNYHCYIISDDIAWHSQTSTKMAIDGLLEHFLYN